MRRMKMTSKMFLKGDGVKRSGRLPSALAPCEEESVILRIFRYVT